MIHNDFAISLVPKGQSGVNQCSTGLLIGLVVLFIAFSVMVSLQTKSNQAMAKTYPSVSVAQAHSVSNL